MTYRASSLRFLLASTAVLALGACGDAPQSTPVAPEEAPLLSSSSGAVLIECPTDLSVSKADTLDVLGGTLRLTDASGGTHEVVFPANALSGPTEISFSVPASKFVEVRVNLKNLVTGETSATFPADAQPTLAISYKRCTRSNILNRSLYLYNIHETNDSILEGPWGSKEGDPADPRVKGKVPHFSDYAIGAG